MVLYGTYAVVMLFVFIIVFVAMILFEIYLCATRKNHSLNFSLALLVSPLQIG